MTKKEHKHLFPYNCTLSDVIGWNEIEKIVNAANNLPLNERVDFIGKILNRVNLIAKHMSDKDKEIITEYLNDKILQINYTENHTEEIICPNCSSQEMAIVQHTEPFFTYIHICSNCKYEILESEWEKVE